MTQKLIAITPQIWVDAEIAAEIQWLNSRGVRTEGSCSGHGKAPPNAIIKPSSAARARELGYEPVCVDGIWGIELDGEDFNGDETHWHGCWRVHHVCCVAQVERLAQVLAETCHYGGGCVVCGNTPRQGHKDNCIIGQELRHLVGRGNDEEDNPTVAG